MKKNFPEKLRGKKKWYVCFVGKDGDMMMLQLVYVNGNKNVEGEMYGSNESKL